VKYVITALLMGAALCFTVVPATGKVVDHPPPGHGSCGFQRDPYEHCTTTATTVLSFRARSVHGAVRLSWTTGAEIDASGYDLMRSDHSFVNRYRVAAHGGSVPAYYTLFDHRPRVGIYRLVEVHPSGTRIVIAKTRWAG
jgi:hypothetical protein